MFTLKWTVEADTQYKELKKQAEASLESRAKKGKKKSAKAEGLFKQVHKCVTLLSQNPRHPGLNTHQYDSLEHPFDKKGKVFEAYAQHETPGAYRVFWCYGPKKNEITIVAITPHP